MVLSYHDFREEKQHRIKARLTTKHSTSSYGQPDCVIEGGGVVRF